MREREQRGQVFRQKATRLCSRVQPLDGVLGVKVLELVIKQIIESSSNKDNCIFGGKT